MAEIFRTIGSPVQLRLLELLLENPRDIDECCAQTGLAGDEVGRHLESLRELGYVTAEPNPSRYRITDPRVTELVRLSQQLTSQRVDALCTCDCIQDGTDRQGDPPGATQE
ncbi:MAG: helix-turn-helix domain-containing protein [Micromonosporaceae bacterium]